MHRKKIALITPSLAKGGLENVVVEEACELESHYDVTLIVMDSFRTDYPYEGRKIELFLDLENRKLVSRFWNLLKGTVKLRKHKKREQFELVISHGELANLPNILSGITANMIVMHENRYAAVKDFQGRVVNHLIRYLYSFENVRRIVTVSEGIRESLIERIGLSPSAINTINNPYDLESIKTRSTLPMECCTALFEFPVLSISGRLTMQKGHWYILRIFRALKQKNPDLKLLILGIGEMKEQLMAVAENLGLRPYDYDAGEDFDPTCDVFFLGFQPNPFAFVKASRLFAMTSLWEGFGNTIVEAMACGTPVISTDCPSGPGEIIAPQRKGTMLTKPFADGNGVLMPVFKNIFVDASVALNDTEQMWVETVDTLLRDEAALALYRERGLQRAEEFRTDKIMQQWTTLIDTVIADVNMEESSDG